MSVVDDAVDLLAVDCQRQGAAEPHVLEDLAQAVWVEGILTAETQESELADAAYTLKLTHIEKYEY